jgi:hypothetical protein
VRLVAAPVRAAKARGEAREGAEKRAPESSRRFSDQSPRIVDSLYATLSHLV